MRQKGLFHMALEEILILSFSPDCSARVRWNIWCEGIMGFLRDRHPITRSSFLGLLCPRWPWILVLKNLGPVEKVVLKQDPALDYRAPRSHIEGRVRIGTVFGSGVVHAKVVIYPNRSQKITYRCPQTGFDVAGEDIVWSDELLAFREWFPMTSVLVPADKLDRCVALSYMTWVKYEQ